MISACVLIRTERGRFDEVVERMKQFSETKSVMAVLGRYDVVVDIEVADYNSLGRVVMKMGNIGGVVFTETLPELKTEAEQKC
ncbi:MAG: Lrp/AsnC ligand binding domain-containing protein [Candidatus Bathyarchaeia archaeon]